MSRDTWLKKKLPEVILESSQGRTLYLPDDILGQWTILYFYPKDDTPGCTKQACGYRDNLENFKKNNIQIFGISGDDIKSHQNFSSKFHLPFELLSDPHQKLSEPLGVYGDQSWQGKTFKGLSRDTFVVDPKGIIQIVWRKVNPEKTIEETLSALKEMI